MRRRKPEPTLLLTQWIFNLPHWPLLKCRRGQFLSCILGEELAIDDALTYAQRENGLAAQLNVMGFVSLSPGSPTPYHNELSYLPTQLNRRSYLYRYA